MKEIVYNKLVRDRVPKIIEESGKQCKTEVLSNERYLEMKNMIDSRKTISTATVTGGVDI